MVEDLHKGDSESDPLSSSESGTVIIWEAFESRTIKQMKLIEQNAPDHLDNHNTVRRMIKEGGFRDGTHILIDSDKANMPTDTDTVPFEPSFEESTNIEIPSPEEEMFDIVLPDSKQTIQIKSTKPVTLESIRNELGKVVLTRDDYYLVYYRDEEAYELQTQESLDEYLRMLDKPQLYIVKTEVFSPVIHHATDISSEEEINIRIMGPVEQDLKLTCPKPVQLDALMNEITSLENLKNQKFNLMYQASSTSSEMEISTQEDFEKYLAISNRPPLLVKVEQDIPESSPITEDIYAVSSNSNTQTDVALESTDDVTLRFKLFHSEHTLDMVCTKPLTLKTVLNDLKLIANLGDQDWQLVYSANDSYITIETQEDFDKYLSMNGASMPTLWITDILTL